MHIPSYQIHNVLNVYRKQLSQEPGKTPRANHSATPPVQDRINISSNGQRQSIMDRISSEIADRLAQFGPETQFDDVLEDELSRPATTETTADAQQDTDFSYTVIDENNRKFTNTLPIQKLGPMVPTSGSPVKPEIEDNFTLDQE